MDYKRLLIISLLAISGTASAADQLLIECQRDIDRIEAQTKNDLERYSDYNRLVIANRPDAARIVQEDQKYLEDLLVSTYAKIPKVASYIQSVRELPKDSPLRSVARRIIFGLEEDAKAASEELSKNTRAYKVILPPYPFFLTKDHEIDGLTMRVSANADLRFIDGKLHLLISTSAHSGGPFYGNMTSGMKIVDLETGEDVLGLNQKPENWGGLTTKQTLVEPYTDWQSKALSIIALNAKDESPSMSACRKHVKAKSSNAN